MNCWKLIDAGILVLAYFFISSDAVAQTNDVAQPLVAVDLDAKVVFERIVEKSYPLSGATGTLTVTSQYGPIRIDTWDNPIVKLQGIIRVGAETAADAESHAQAISIDGSQTENRVAIRTSYPEAKLDEAVAGYTVELRVTVPREIAVTIENRFGDCFVKDLANDLTVDVRYGLVELSNLDGTVRVRAKGDFPLKATGLHRGGTFFLRSTQASFFDVGGRLTVNNYLGSVTLGDVRENSDVSITSDNGPISYTLPEKNDARVDVYSEFGEIQSDIPLNIRDWGSTSSAHFGDKSASRQVELHVSFESVRIRTPERTAGGKDLNPAPGDSVQDKIQSEMSIAPGKTVLIDAMHGTITLEAVEGTNKVEVKATRRVRIEDVKNAQLALEGLQLAHSETDSEIRIQSSVRENMKSLGVQNYSMNIHVRYPQSSPLQVVHSSGATNIIKPVQAVTVEQKKGSVRVDGASGSVDIANQSGNVIIENSTGRVTVSTQNGSIQTTQTKGTLDLKNRNGKIVVDSPSGKVTARNTGGEIRIIALEGVFDEFDVKAIEGNVSMVMLPDSDAWVFLNVEDGEVYSAYPVTGTHEKNTHVFQGRLNKATHRVVLEAKGGNVVLD